jgi:hypothetical protein
MPKIKDKFIIYIPKSDSILMDGNIPYVDTEKNVKWVIENEVVHKKNYEPKPIKFLQTWAKRQKKEEETRSKAPYLFSPMCTEFQYTHPKGRGNYLLIVGEEDKKNSGNLVKDFDSVEDAARLANKSIDGLAKEFPNLKYFIYDVRNFKYVRTIEPQNTKSRKRGRQTNGAV